jgi:hypothetical protein
MTKYVLVVRDGIKANEADSSVSFQRPFPNIKERHAYFIFIPPQTVESSPALYHIKSISQDESTLKLFLGNRFVCKYSPPVLEAPYAYFPLSNFGFMQVTNGGFLIQIEK